MTRYLAAYASTLIVMVALDMLWLGVIAKPLYQDAIGHLMSQRPRIVIAAIFYAVYALGLMIFVVQPQRDSGWGQTIAMGALFGFFAYATYDLTNLATLKDWPVGITLVDMAWGCLVSAASVAAGKAILVRFLAD